MVGLLYSGNGLRYKRKRNRYRRRDCTPRRGSGRWGVASRLDATGRFRYFQNLPPRFLIRVAAVEHDAV
jgi:hypothetical protein